MASNPSSSKKPATTSLDARAAEIDPHPPTDEANDRAPGALRSVAWLSVQTRQAQRLVQGRRASDDKAGIIGLTRYAALLRPIWNGARSDDPYADHWLVKIESFLDEGEAELQMLIEQVKKAMSFSSGITVSLAESLEPIRVPLTFSNPYGFRGAALIGIYDELVRTILTARHVAAIDRATSERLLNDGGRLVRRAFNAANGYKFLGVTRDDIKAGNQRAQQAKEAMGDVPELVLKREMRAPNAPPILSLAPLRMGASGRFNSLRTAVAKRASPDESTDGLAQSSDKTE